MTNQLYLNDTYLLESPASIIAIDKDEKGFYIVLDQTIFYPQGGGQPADQGLIAINGIGDIAIFFVRRVEQEIRHYATDIEGVQQGVNMIGRDVICKIDRAGRMLNAKYHTAAHLLGNVIEVINPNVKAVKGHSFPNEAYVEFVSSDLSHSDIINKDTVQEVLTKATMSSLTIKAFAMLPAEFEQKFYKLPYPAPSNKVFRAVQIGHYDPVPCGGTHLREFAEVGDISIRKIHNKNGRVKISYDVK